MTAELHGSSSVASSFSGAVRRRLLEQERNLARAQHEQDDLLAQITWTEIEHLRWLARRNDLHLSFGEQPAAADAVPA